MRSHGFSMGGHWAVWLAQHPPPAVMGTVLYYATQAGDFGHARSPLLAHFAEREEFVSALARGKIELAITRQGLHYTAHEYPRTGHRRSWRPGLQPSSC